MTNEFLNGLGLNTRPRRMGVLGGAETLALDMLIAVVDDCDNLIRVDSLPT